MAYDTLDNEQPQAAVSGGGFLRGLVVGALAGAALGVLFAPKSGVHTRRDLSRSASRMKGRAIKNYTRASDAVSDFVERSQEVIERGRKSFEDARASAMRATGRG